MEQPFDTITVTVLDGVGCGEAHDTKERYPEDSGANSLLHASEHARLDAPALQSMGLEYIPHTTGRTSTTLPTGRQALSVTQHIPLPCVRGAYGTLEPTFAGKGSPEGHQALMGYEIQKPYLYFDKTGFPADLIQAIEREISLLLGRPVQVIRYPGTDDVSGTVFIEHPSIGTEHMASLTMTTAPLKIPIYASSDSVIQIAIHQEVLPQDVIEKIGHTVRTKVCDALGFRIGRVIMRPFIGTPGNFARVSADRRDFAVDPDGPTVIDALTESGIPVYGIGKAPDMLNHRGFPKGSTEKLDDDFERVEAIKSWIQDRAPHPSLLFANLNATDELFGHRRNPTGYINHINTLDTTFGHITKLMTDRDLLIITSDHGNDPTHAQHTNHTRERVPLLVFHPGIRGPIALDIRQTYADIAATIAENFGIEICHGRSFLGEIL